MAASKEITPQARRFDSYCQQTKTKEIYDKGRQESFTHRLEDEITATDEKTSLIEIRSVTAWVNFRTLELVKCAKLVQTPNYPKRPKITTHA